MNKEQFITKLREELSILPQEEQTDIIGEYLMHINEQIARGSSEEEAVAQFGDVHELAVEILEAYKEFEVKQSKKETINFLDKFSIFHEKVKQFSVNLANDILKSRSTAVNLMAAALYYVFLTLVALALFISVLPLIGKVFIGLLGFLGVLMIVVLYGYTGYIMMILFGGMYLSFKKANIETDGNLSKEFGELFGTLWEHTKAGFKNVVDGLKKAHDDRKEVKKEVHEYKREHSKKEREDNKRDKKLQELEEWKAQYRKKMEARLEKQQIKEEKKRFEQELKQSEETVSQSNASITHKETVVVPKSNMVSEETLDDIRKRVIERKKQKDKFEYKVKTKRKGLSGMLERLVYNVTLLVFKITALALFIAFSVLLILNGIGIAFGVKMYMVDPGTIGILLILFGGVIFLWTTLKVFAKVIASKFLW